MTVAKIYDGAARSKQRQHQFLFVYMSSVAEVQSHLYVALNQKYISQAQFEKTYEQAQKTAKIISGLIKYLQTKQTKQTE